MEYHVRRNVDGRPEHFQITTAEGVPTVSVDAEEDVVAIVVYYHVRDVPKSKGMALDVAQMDALAIAWLEARAIPIARKRYDAAKAAELAADEAWTEALRGTEGVDEAERRRWARRHVAELDAAEAGRELDRARAALEALGVDMDMDE